MAEPTKAEQKPAGPIRLRGVRLPANVMLPNGTTGFAIGQNAQSGFGAEGTIKEMRVSGGNVLVELDNGQSLVLFSSGMLGEVLP